MYCHKRGYSFYTNKRILLSIPSYRELTCFNDVNYKQLIRLLLKTWQQRCSCMFIKEMSALSWCIILQTLKSIYEIVMCVKILLYDFDRNNLQNWEDVTWTYDALVHLLYSKSLHNLPNIRLMSVGVYKNILNNFIQLLLLTSHIMIQFIHNTTIRYLYNMSSVDVCTYVNTYTSVYICVVTLIRSWLTIDAHV